MRVRAGVLHSPEPGGAAVGQDVRNMLLYMYLAAQCSHVPASRAVRGHAWESARAWRADCSARVHLKRPVRSGGTG